MQLPSIPLAILLACLTTQGTTKLQPVRHPTCVRFYSYEGDVRPELLRKELDALATKDAKARIAAGPSKVSSRPMSRFIVLEVPARTPAKDIESALKRICPHAEELAWTAFQGKSRTLPAILGYPALDCVVGMDNDLRWFDLAEGRARFFFSRGKFDAKSLRTRFGKLYQPFDAGELGELVHDAIEWKLAAPVDPAAAKVAEKAIAKIPGVRKARIDVANCALTAEIEQDGLRGAAQNPGKDPSADKVSERSLSAAGFLLDDVIDALEAAKMTLEAAPSGGEKH